MQALLLAVTIGLASGQTAGQQYAGTWIAELKATTFVRLELATDTGTLGGRVGLGNIHVDSTGEVDSAEDAPHDLTPIIDLVVEPTSISFARQDGNDIDHFKMTLTVEGADLTLVLSDAEREELAKAGIAAPKPLHLKRIKP